MRTKISRRQILKGGVGVLSAAVLPHFGSATEVHFVETVEQEVAGIAALPSHAITHGGLQVFPHPGLGVDVVGQTATRYLRFGQPVELDSLEIGRLVYGRWVPSVPTHPAHLVISVLDKDTFAWKTIHEKELPAEPEIAGEGLSQQMKIEDAEAHFSRIMKKPAHQVALKGYLTDHIRVVCDREHPTWPNHGECNGGVHNVPFGILNNLSAFGKTTGQSLFKMAYEPILKRGSIRPQAPAGMQVHDLPDMLLFQGNHLSIGFSLRRPMLMHLGWDALGQDPSKLNRLFAARQATGVNGICGTSGPVLRTLYGDYPAHLWTGEIEVEGNRIHYKKLHAVEGLTVDAIFTVEAGRVVLELTQDCAADMPVIEAETWRLAMDLKKGITGMAGMPSQHPGRNGDVLFPAMWTSDGNGCISWSLLKGEPATTRLQVESYRVDNCISGGIVFGSHAEAGRCQVLRAGKQTATFKLEVTNLEPKKKPGAPEPSMGLKRHWATIFSCFRPEYRGFSNNASSVNCHLSQGPPIEIAAHTSFHSNGLNPLNLARFTIEKAFLDGGGYGYHRNLYMDSDPMLLSAAGRIHQADPDLKWLKRIEPGVVRTVNRMLNMIGEEGLVICRDLTGNSGSYRWSSNSMDVVGFGHIDSYVNAWSYRAFRNAAAILDDLSQHKALVQKCREAARSIRQHYAPALLNPATGWIAGWRSSDGELHDYAFTWINAVAIAFGLIDAKPARHALLQLEKKRLEVGAEDARMGIPLNLVPIRENDHMLAKIQNQIQPTFETYTDGSLSGWPATYYLRALSSQGLSEHSKNLARQLAEGYEAGIFTGGIGSGDEFRSWDGLRTGYEGTLIGCIGPVYGIAIEEGIFDPPNPEWWPANG